MIEGLEPLYQELADQAAMTLPDGWQKLRIEAVFYAEEEVDYWFGYIARDGNLGGLGITSELCEVLRGIRAKFHESNQPVFGQVVFSLTNDGKFSLDLGYDNCDENGDTIYSSEAYQRWVKDHINLKTI
jgi:hypothetical protein